MMRSGLKYICSDGYRRFYNPLKVDSEHLMSQLEYAYQIVRVSEAAGVSDVDHRYVFTDIFVDVNGWKNSIVSYSNVGVNSSEGYVYPNKLIVQFEAPVVVDTVSFPETVNQITLDSSRKVAYGIKYTASGGDLSYTVYDRDGNIVYSGTVTLTSYTITNIYNVIDILSAGFTSEKKGVVAYQIYDGTYYLYRIAVIDFSTNSVVYNKGFGALEIYNRKGLFVSSDYGLRYVLYHSVTGAKHYIDISTTYVSNDTSLTNTAASDIVFFDVNGKYGYCIYHVTSEYMTLYRFGKAGGYSSVDSPSTGVANESWEIDATFDKLTFYCFYTKTGGYITLPDLTTGSITELPSPRIKIASGTGGYGDISLRTFVQKTYGSTKILTDGASLIISGTTDSFSPVFYNYTNVNVGSGKWLSDGPTGNFFKWDGTNLLRLYDIDFSATFDVGTLETKTFTFDDYVDGLIVFVDYDKFNNLGDLKIDILSGDGTVIEENVTPNKYIVLPRGVDSIKLRFKLYGVIDANLGIGYPRIYGYGIAVHT